MHSAFLTRTEGEMTRLAVHEPEGKTNMGSLCGRKFYALEAKILSRLNMLGAPVDPSVMQMLSRAQLLEASWRKAVGCGSQSEREAGAVFM